MKTILVNIEHTKTQKRGTARTKIKIKIIRWQCMLTQELCAHNFNNLKHTVKYTIFYENSMKFIIVKHTVFFLHFYEVQEKHSLLKMYKQGKWDTKV